MGHYVDKSGTYLGFFDEESSPSGSDYVNLGNNSPSNGFQVWLFPGWSDDLESRESERLWRNGELLRADVELNKSQDGDGAGTVKAWREYRKALRAWPSAKGFPSPEFRPVPPDSQV